MTKIVSRYNAIRLTSAILDVIAALPLSLVLAILSAQLVFNFWPANSEVPLSSAVVIVVALVWVALMLMLTVVLWIRPLLVVGAIPLAFLLNGYPVSRNQAFVALGALMAFLALTRLLRRFASPALALATVPLAYGLYLFPPLQPVFTSHTTAAIAWFIALLLCWILLAIPSTLSEKPSPVSVKNYQRLRLPLCHPSPKKTL